MIFGSIGNRAEARERLVARLLGRLLHLSQHELSLSVGLPVLKADGLGRPFLSLPSRAAPSVSLSHCGSRTWACLAWTAAVGIDVASPGEFRAPYPFARVFHRGEMEEAGKFCGRPLHDRAALLWALKEAAVKALGCGFNFFDPLDVRVKVCKPMDGGLHSEVDAGRVLPAWALRIGRDWVAICAASPS